MMLPASPVSLPRTGAGAARLGPPVAIILPAGHLVPHPHSDEGVPTPAQSQPLRCPPQCHGQSTGLRLTRPLPVDTASAWLHPAPLLLTQHRGGGDTPAIPGDPRAACCREPASVNRTKLIGRRASGGALPSRGRFPRRRAGGRLWGGTSSLCGLLLAFRHLQRPWGDSGRGDVPSKQDMGPQECGREQWHGDAAGTQCQGRALTPGR